MPEITNDDKILFLDIDGVISTIEQIAKGMQDSRFDPRAIFQLHRIIQATGCKIILSSVWRHFPLLHLEKAFSQSKNHELGKAIMMSIVGQTGKEQYPRGKEITTWIKDHNFTGKFVILDDQGDLQPLMEHVVLVNQITGLTKDAADEVIRRLVRG